MTQPQEIKRPVMHRQRPTREQIRTNVLTDTIIALQAESQRTGQPAGTISARILDDWAKARSGKP